MVIVNNGREQVLLRRSVLLGSREDAMLRLFIEDLFISRVVNRSELLVLLQSPYSK